MTQRPAGKTGEKLVTGEAAVTPPTAAAPQLRATPLLLSVVTLREWKPRASAIRRVAAGYQLVSLKDIFAG